MERIETQSRQLALANGLRQTASDLIVVAEPANLFAPEARKGRLYIVVEADPGSPRAAQACQLAIRTIRRAFYEDSSSSVTAGLRAALRAANKALYEYNIGQPIRQRAQVGCTCAALKDGELFVAQVQPAQAYALSEGQLRALPAHPSWDPAHVSVAPFAHAGALGNSLFIEPELYRCLLRPGDAAVLCSSNFAHALSRSAAENLLHLASPQAMADELERVAEETGLSDVHGLAITASASRRPAAQPDPAGTATAKVRHSSRPNRGWLGALRDKLGGRGQPEPPADPPRPDPLHTMPERPAHSPTPPPRPAPIDLGESLSARYERVQQQRPTPTPPPSANTAELPPSSFLGEETYPPPPRRIDLGDASALAAGARPYRPRYELRPMVDLTLGERLALPFRRITVAVEDAIRARRNRRTAPPPQRPILRGQGLSYRRTRPPFPWLLLLGLIISIGGLIAYGLTLSQQSDVDLAEEYIAIADQRLADVRQAASESVALERLDIASEAIDEVRASPEVTRSNVALWTRYQELQREYERSLATVQRQTFFDEPRLLATHPLPTGRFGTIVVPPSISSITDTAVLEGLRYIYALDGDPQNSRLYRIPRDGGPPQPYLSPNEAVGTAVVGPLRAALWRLDQVVAVDEAPSGFGYYFRQGDSWNYSKLGASEIWNVRERLDIEEYDGNLYVWGAEPDEVLKFKSGSYGDQPEYWLDPAGIDEVDLSTVVDMAVDGSIYLLRPNGSVLVFSLGRVVGEIKPDTITPPIRTVTRFAVTGTPEEGSIFMIEPLNERIIQMDKRTGRVIQQIKVRPDDDMRLDVLSEITVDDSGSRPILYLVNQGQIVRAELPAPPRGFREGEATPTP